MSIITYVQNNSSVSKLIYVFFITSEPGHSYIFNLLLFI